MWLDIGIFSFALLGLIALFALKALELRGASGSLLSPLRRAWDPVLRRGWLEYRQTFHSRTRELARAGSEWCVAQAHQGYSSFLEHSHRAVLRLHDHLNRRRRENGSGGTVSAHLKSVLEKTEQKTTE